MQIQAPLKIRWLCAIVVNMKTMLSNDDDDLQKTPDNISEAVCDHWRWRNNLIRNGNSSLMLQLAYSRPQFTKASKRFHGSSGVLLRTSDLWSTDCEFNSRPCTAIFARLWAFIVGDKLLVIITPRSLHRVTSYMWYYVVTYVILMTPIVTDGLTDGQTYNINLLCVTSHGKNQTLATCLTL